MSIIARGGSLMVSTAGAGLVNDRGHPWQDRWMASQSSGGAWLVVADGITGGQWGEFAAESAAAVASRVLAGSDLLEGAVLSAIEAAHAAVRPWYRQATGGATLSIAALTSHRLVAGAVGDSPILRLRGGRLARLSPTPPPGPLQAWVGQADPVMPWLDSWPSGLGECVVVCSDGIEPGAVAIAPDAPLTGLVQTLLTSHRRAGGDDACVVAARLERPSRL